MEHVTPIPHFNTAPQMAQISTPQPIFISTEGRGPNQMELLHRTAARRITATRRNFTRFHWSTPHHGMAHQHAHARHQMQAAMPHQNPLPLQTASAYSGILLNFL